MRARPERDSGRGGKLVHLFRQPGNLARSGPAMDDALGGDLGNYPLGALHLGSRAFLVVGVHGGEHAFGRGFYMGAIRFVSLVTFNVLAHALERRLMIGQG